MSEASLGEPMLRGFWGDPMHIPGTFALYIQPGDPPARVKNMIQGHVTDTQNRVFVTPDCLSFDELESYINGLQDDLDHLRERARRAFSPSDY